MKIKFAQLETRDKKISLETEELKKNLATEITLVTQEKTVE